MSNLCLFAATYFVWQCDNLNAALAAKTQASFKELPVGSWSWSLLTNASVDYTMQQNVAVHLRVLYSFLLL